MKVDEYNTVNTKMKVDYYNMKTKVDEYNMKMKITNHH